MNMHACRHTYVHICFHVFIQKRERERDRDRKRCRAQLSKQAALELTYSTPQLHLAGSQHENCSARARPEVLAGIAWKIPNWRVQSALPSTVMLRASYTTSQQCFFGNQKKQELNDFRDRTQPRPTNAFLQPSLRPFKPSTPPRQLTLIMCVPV